MAARANVLWGKGGRGLVSVAMMIAALAVPLVAGAEDGARGKGSGHSANVPKSLRAAAEADPNATFEVIVQGRGSTQSVAGAVASTRDSHPGKGVKKRFEAISGVAAELTGKQLLKLAARDDVLAVSEDGPIGAAGVKPYSNQLWPYKVDVDNFWPANNYKPPPLPTIAIVDSGIDASRPDLAGRVLKQVVLTSRTPNSPGDGRGHGTYVASIAAGGAAGHTGAVPTANLVSLDVLDDSGMGVVSDLLAACDWILQNKEQYGIRVANFSLHSARESSFMYDPLDKAVEKLWFSGVVVVAAAGNYGQPDIPSGVKYAPANDPFVITVGALDLGPNGGATTNAPWSAHGYTLDGFRKPELGAPGRYMIGAVPPLSTMALTRPDRIVEPGYMRMSGTSFAAPVVAGTVAGLLGTHPSWGPDQVKGALMLAARTDTDSSYVPYSLGVGRLEAGWANDVAAPPNPNEALNAFLAQDPNGGPVPVFDSASWATAAQADASWATASWATASWASASWDAASWATASWATASWATASWDAASWATGTEAASLSESLLWVE